MQNLPDNLARLLAEGRDFLARKRAADADLASAKKEAERQAAVQNWDGLVAAVREDLGPDLFAFATLGRSAAWDKQDRRSVVSINVPGLAKILALYTRPGDGPWKRDTWDQWIMGSDWEITHWEKGCGEWAGELLESNQPLRCGDVAEALALAAEAEAERVRLQAEIDAEAQARKDAARTVATDKLLADLAPQVAVLRSEISLQLLAEALKPHLGLD